MLRSARGRAGLTQEELATRAELSVRTLRSLELDATATPRAGSVTRLADALGLTAGDRRIFLKAWGINRDRQPLTVAQMMGPAGRRAGVPDEVRARFHDTHAVSVVRAVRVGASGSIELERTDKVIEADRNHVDTVILALGGSGDRPTQPRIIEVDGVTLTRTIHPPGSRWTVFELGLPVRLRRGERYSLAVTAEFPAPADSPEVAAAVGPATANVVGQGFSRAAHLCVLRASFPSGRDDCSYVARERFDGPEVSYRPLDAQGGIAQVIIDSPASGWHGITWGRPAPAFDGFS